MSPVARLKEIAAEVAMDAKGSQARLERELSKIEAEKLKIETALKAARLAQQRLAEFPVTIAGQPICPRCWISHGTQSTMRERSSDRPREDRYYCDGCALEFYV